MRDWESSGGAKIERAKEHVADFERAAKTFLESHRYSASSQFDPKRKAVSFVVQRCHTIPPRLAAITADAIHNLRASLDILWHQAWCKGIAGKRKQYFPVVRNPRELESRFKSVNQAAHIAAVDILRSIKSVESWSKLRALHEIDARDKHEIPILAAASYKQVIMKFPSDVALQGRTGVQVVSKLGSGFIFLDPGIKLPLVMSIETDAGPITAMESDLTAEIAFAKGEILEGAPVLKTLQDSILIVDGIANAFLAAGHIR